MSSRDPRSYLYDIVDACDTIREVLGGCDLSSYSSDTRIRLATERELIIVGEAVARLLEVSPGLASSWAVGPRDVVGLRNVLVHGYFTVDDARVFGIASEDVPSLRDDAHRTLAELDD